MKFFRNKLKIASLGVATHRLRNTVLSHNDGDITNETRGVKTVPVWLIGQNFSTSQNDQKLRENSKKSYGERFIPLIKLMNLNRPNNIG